MYCNDKREHPSFFLVKGIRIRPSLLGDFLLEEVKWEVQEKYWPLEGSILHQLDPKGRWMGVLNSLTLGVLRELCT